MPAHTIARNVLVALDGISSHLGNLSDAQLAHYGRYVLAAAGLFYLASSYKATIPADVQYAIDAHVPQGYDRSIIAARLEQRHTKQVLLDCLQLAQLKEKLRTETDREAKLRGWDEVLRRTLVGMLASAYTHSLTISLFAVKNTARVLVFVLRHREEAAAERCAGNGSATGGGGSGPLSKMKSWWQGGTQAVMLEMIMSRIAAQRNQQSSPFANAGLDEEAVPSLPVDGRAAFVYAQAVSQELAAAENDDDDSDDSEERGLTGEEGSPATGHTVGATVVGELEVSLPGEEWGPQRRGRLPHGSTFRSADSAASARAERLFSIKDTLAEAIPRIVETASTVVERVFARYPPGTFGAAATISTGALRKLLAELCLEMERSACVAEWVHPSLDSCCRSMGAAPPAPRCARRRTDSVQSQDVKPEGLEAPEGMADDQDDDGEDVVRFPAGSTAMLGPNGLPLPRPGSARRSTEAASAGAGAGAATLSDEAFMNGVFGVPRRPSVEVRRQHREAMKQQLALKQQTTGFFQELIHSASFGELCIDYADSVLARAFCAAADISGVRSYDPVSDAARVLMVITALEAHRQRLLDAIEFEIQPSMKFFCEETVRSTCSQS